jgi:hypothetical protein
MTMHRLAFIDASRSIRASMGFAGANERQIDALLWQPSTATPWPLVIYCHGTDGTADNAIWLAETLLEAGYLVLAPYFPLTSRAALTGIAGPDISDAGEQVNDVRFLIERLLADPIWGAQIDAKRIGSAPGKGYGRTLALLASLFFMWGFITVINNTLLPHLRSVFDLNYTQTTLIESVWFIAYAVGLPD